MAENSKVFNLDENVEEYFDFIVKGIGYRFTHLTSEEMEKIKDFGDSAEKVSEYLYSFITPLKEGDPAFTETAKKMIVKQQNAFSDLLMSQMGLDGNNQSAKATK